MTENPPPQETETEMFSGLWNRIWPRAKSTSPPLAEPESTLMRFLKDKTRLFEVIPDLEDRVCGSNSKTLFTLIKGLVQSGKAKLSYALLVYLSAEKGHNVSMVFRDMTGDYKQFRNLGGLEPFLREYADYAESLGEKDVELPSIYYMGDVGLSPQGVLSKHEALCTSLASGGTLLLALGNAPQMMKMNEVLDLVLCEGNTMTLSVVIDEADLLMYSEGEIFSPQLDRLLEKSLFAYGVSASVMDIFHDSRFRRADVYFMAPQPGYKGMRDIMFREIEPVDESLKKEKPEAMLEWDPSLCRFLVDHTEHGGFDIHEEEKHPMMTLLKTERMIRHQDAMLNTLVEDPRFKDAYTIIVYNGSDTKLYDSSLVGQEIGRLPGIGQKRTEKRSTSRYHVFRQCPVQYVLQYLKENGGATRFPRILIISHGLVGRGVNVVSADFGWHLTHMFYRPASGASIATMMQSIRLCGVHRDTIQPVCFMEPRYYEDLYKGNRLQEEIVRSAMQHYYQENEDATESMPLWLAKQSFLEEKIPKARLVRQGAFLGKRTRDASEDTGMSLDEFFQDRIPMAHTVTPAADVGEETMKDDEFKKIARRFRTWGKGVSKPAQMMHHVDPHRLYTKAEFKTLCKEYKQDPHWFMKETEKWGNGKIMVEDEDGYRVNPRLVKEFEKNF